MKAQTGTGTGPGVITADGCAVEFYALLPTRGEPEIIAAAVPPRSTILDLGSGSGHIADPLSRIGFRVVAVDNSPAMLDHVQVAEPFLAEITGLDLRRSFDTVLLCSHLVNVADADARGEFLATAARHTRTGGNIVIEWHPPGWFDNQHAGDTQHGTLGDVVVELQVHSHHDRLQRSGPVASMRRSRAPLTCRSRGHRSSAAWSKVGCWGPLPAR